MMSKSQRWHETLVKTSTPAQKKGRKDLAALATPVPSGGKQLCSATSKPGGSCGKSSSLTRGSDSTERDNKVGGSLKRSNLSHRGSVGHQGGRQPPHAGRPALRLCSSQSFSSLHTSSFTAAPFIRSSRSLSRLDQRSTGKDSDQAAPNSQVKKGQTSEKKVLNLDLSSCEEQIRENKDQCCCDNVEEKKTGSSAEPLEAPFSSVSTSVCHHHDNKLKEQTIDGVHMLCAMTSGIRHHWVQAVLKNVRPGLTPDIRSSFSEQNTQQETADSQSAEVEQKSEQPNKKESDAASCLHLLGNTQTGAGSHSSISTVEPSSAEGCDEHSNLGGEIKQSWQVVETTVQNEEQHVSINNSECMTDRETLLCQQQTGQLVKELEQTQKELSRLQQLNRTLQDELQHEREKVHPQNDLLSNSSEKAIAFQQLQKMNNDLRMELEAQKRSQEEVREAELRRRVDLLAQQAQLLVTGDATTLAQAHLERDRRRFHEQQMEWEHCLSSLKSQLSTSEEQRREAESRLSKLEQESQSYHSLQQEADRLQKQLQEVKTQLCANEEAQAQKEARLQKHLTLLQASQDRERRSLAASLTQAEQHSQDLQERLDRAQDQVESLNKAQTWTREIEEARQQLQEELACTVSAVEKLQEEREQLEHHCQELQNQLSEADGEVSRLQSRLKTEETHYYNLEHSYERACEDLQVALSKVQQRDSETQEIREGYERMLDRKEQELSEVLLKMEVLGNSLEETEVKLNEMLKVCNCASSWLKTESSEPTQHNLRRQETSEPLAVNDSRPKATDSDQLSNSSNEMAAVEVNGNLSHEHARTRSHSTDLSYQYIVSMEDDPERFMSVIQSLETKLYVTEEKLRDITQRLEEHQNHISCQDPHLCSQLTQSRATAQHLSLLLHSQAKQSQRFAQEAESRCRILAGRFQVALNIIQACRERLQATPINITHFEKQLATVAACLQQGQSDAEKQQHEAHNASKGEDKILHDEPLATDNNSIGAKSDLSNTLPPENDMASVRKCLMRELFVVQKMLNVLQGERGLLFSVLNQEDYKDVAQRYKSIISQTIALKTEGRTQSGKAEYESNEHLEDKIGRVCAEAELIYAALIFQQQYENNQDEEQKKKGLADITPPELAPYEEQVKLEDRGFKDDTRPAEKYQFDNKMEEAEKEPDWLERLISRLQRRTKFLKQLCQGSSGGPVSEGSVDFSGDHNSAVDMIWMQEQAKLIYLSQRLLSDLDQELLQNKIQALNKERDITSMDEQEAFNHTLNQLQEDNGMLRQELKSAEQKIISVESEKQRLLGDIQKIDSYHEEHRQKLETKFQQKMTELQQIHEEEMKHLHGCYTKEKQTKTCTEALSSTSSIKELRNELVEGDAVAVLSNPDDLKKPEDHDFTPTEDMHRKLIGDLQHQHQTEVAALLKEKDQLLQEETAATLAAIVAMRRAHKQELERCRQSQHIRESADITQLHVEYKKEIQLLHKELEVLSIQHAQKCLENTHLSQELQDERKSSMQYQKENQELKNKQGEMDETSESHFSVNEKQSLVAAPISDFYEMQVILRAREAEMQFLRQEARSLREELKIARMDKIYAQNKLKALYKNSQDEPLHNVNKICEELKFATWSPGKDASGQSHKDSMTSASNAAFLKKAEKSSLTRQIRGVRSKSLKECLSVQERMKLFESL